MWCWSRDWNYISRAKDWKGFPTTLCKLGRSNADSSVGQSIHSADLWFQNSVYRTVW